MQDQVVVIRQLDTVLSHDSLKVVLLALVCCYALQGRRLANLKEVELLRRILQLPLHDFNDFVG